MFMARLMVLISQYAWVVAGAHKGKEQATLLDMFEEFVTYIGSMTIILFESVVIR